MRYVLLVLAIVGVVVSAFALREHYRTDTSPCSINEKWDCGIVNHSPYAVIWKVPVAIIGIVGYLLMAVMSFRRAYPVLLATVSVGLGFSLYFAHIEAHVLGVWCIYCVASLAVMSLMSVLVVGTVIARLVLRRSNAAASLTNPPRSG